MAEGFVTAYSLHKATGLPTIMAVSSSNFGNVAEVFKEKLPEGTPFIIATDDDSAKTSAGIKAAQKAAKKYGKDAVIQVVEFPESVTQKFMRTNNNEIPTDFNDLAVYGSYTAVKEQIDKAIERHKQQQNETVEMPPTSQQEKNIMANDNPNLHPENLNETRNMREQDFRQMLDVAVQNGSLNNTVNRLNDRFNDDFLDNNAARLSASYEMSQRIKNNLPENEQTQAAHDVLATMEKRMNTSDDELVLEVADRAEHLAKTWQHQAQVI
ncbi:toprim domain-containing protein, partial [Kingella kingae]|uniref:toprim domain-containing protein n=1 Tax=Kingella kingae TaxID=504 RepID=UPI00254F9046